jgi:hypothetical protein
VIFGPDVSRYQGDVDHGAVRREGHDFLIAKITQGQGLKDPKWPRNRDGARAAGLITLGYHYITTDNPNAQAANCAAWIGDRGIGVALDHERGGGNITQFRAVLDAFGRAGLRVVLSYIPPFYWREIGSPPLNGLPPLWKARYPSTQSGPPRALYGKVPPNYWDAYGGMVPVLLQFSDAAMIAGQKTDCNAFRGSRAEFAALVGAGGGGGVPQVEEGLFMGLPDAEQVELRDKIRNLYFQLVTGDGQPADPATWGWGTFGGGTTAGGHPERLTPVDYWRRNNVRVEDLARQVQALRTEVAALGATLSGVGAGPGLDPQLVAEVLREAVAAAGFELHGSLVPASASRGAHAGGDEPPGI